MKDEAAGMSRACTLTVLLVALCLATADGKGVRFCIAYCATGVITSREGCVGAARADASRAAGAAVLAITCPGMKAPRVEARGSG